MDKPLLRVPLGILNDTLKYPENRPQLISKFLTSLRNAPESSKQGLEWKILSELALDLEYYEPDPRIRSEDSSYYGDERAEEEIKAALKSLKEGGISVEFENEK
jgi:hypothetical protein